MRTPSLPVILLLFCLPAGLVGCAAQGAETSQGSANPIVAGEPMSHPAVGKLYLAYENTGCTASLIGPRTALTAAHCCLATEMFFKLDQREARGVCVMHPDYHAGQVSWRPDPEHPTEYWYIPHDFAVVLLAESFEGVQPLTLARTTHAEAVRLLGYGITSPSGRDHGELRGADNRIAHTAPGFYVIESADSQARNIVCFGDSGGPVLADPGGEQERIVAVHSASNPMIPCTRYGTHGRVDAQDEGQYCWITCQASEDLQGGPNDPRTEGCSCDALISHRRCGECGVLFDDHHPQAENQCEPAPHYFGSHCEGSTPYCGAQGQCTAQPQPYNGPTAWGYARGLACRDETNGDRMQVEASMRRGNVPTWQFRGPEPGLAHSGWIEDGQPVALYGHAGWLVATSRKGELVFRESTVKRKIVNWHCDPGDRDCLALARSSLGRVQLPSYSTTFAHPFRRPVTTIVRLPTPTGCSEDAARVPIQFATEQETRYVQNVGAEAMMCFWRAGQCHKWLQTTLPKGSEFETHWVDVSNAQLPSEVLAQCECSSEYAW